MTGWTIGYSERGKYWGATRGTVNLTATKREDLVRLIHEHEGGEKVPAPRVVKLGLELTKDILEMLITIVQVEEECYCKDTWCMFCRAYKQRDELSEAIGEEG